MDHAYNCNICLNVDNKMRLWTGRKKYYDIPSADYLIERIRVTLLAYASPLVQIIALSHDDMICFVTGNAFCSRWCSVRQLTLDETQTAIGRSLRAVQSICDAVNSKNINAYRPTRYKTRYICSCWGRREFFSIIKRDFRETKEEIPSMANGKWIIARVILDRCVFLSFFLSLSKPIVLYNLISDEVTSPRNDLDDKDNCHICYVE